MEQLKQKTQVLNKHALRIPFLDLLSTKTKLEPGLLLAIILALTSLILLLTAGVQLATLFVTVLYPGYHTLKALDSQKFETDWLCYWTVFGIYSLLEELLFFVFDLIPLYRLIRLAFFVYLWLPRTQGALVIYEMVISPLFAQNRDKLKVKLEKQASNNSNGGASTYNNSSNVQVNATVNANVYG